VEHTEIRLSFLSDARLLHTVRCLVRGYFQGKGLALEKLDDVVLAVDEACANAIRHSYGGRPGGWLDVTFSTGDGFAVVSLSDKGVPADREQVRRKETQVPTPESVRPGGLGVQFIYRVFDEVRFEPGEHEGNRVTMRLAFDAAGNGDAYARGPKPDVS